MTIKKLTMAAAIAVGIATCSINTAMAACPCSSTPSCASPPCACATPCNSCCDKCKCNPCKCNPCDCDPCKKSCDPCCDPCAKPATPACATCPNTSCADLDMKQVYAYPNAIYGDNNYVGEQKNAIYSTETAWAFDNCDSLALSRAGVSVVGCGQMTGAAVPLTCDGMPIITGAAAPCCGCNSMPLIGPSACGCGCLNNGAIVDRNCCKMDNSCCPIQIQTSNSIDALKKSFVPFEPNIAGTQCSCGCTGAAAPLVDAFPDVPSNYWAACPIDKLAMNNVVVGYPDRLFRPCKDVSRAEFATMIVKGYNLNCSSLPTKNIFKDVPRSHWANSLIAKAVDEGIMCGYPGCKFKPNNHVSRVEALTAMAHSINCEMDSCKAQQILSQYCDGDKVPSWAQIPVAKALETGILKNSLTPNTINPCKDASRAEIADMLQTTRIAMGLDTNPATACDCPKPADPCCPKKAYMEQEEIVKIPTLKLEFLDEINAKSSHVGQQFATTTLEEVTINGHCYPCGSRVNGKIVEVIRPSGCEKGALKLAFTTIEDCSGCCADLPRQILTAQINCAKTQNAVARLVSMPFTWAGALVGTTGRTIGGMISNAGNAFESVSNGVGIASGEIFQGQFRASGRSLQDAGKAAIVAPVDFARTAFSGATGLFQTTGDEVAYLVDPKGYKVAAVNPKEHLTIAFGCSD
ncbi:MAG TPA: S-layer homology domain-containing protein [Candidatus Gastranaerophilaceae bacterium]|nr:S-layer homology domain-containing protein [Candidatus Gastranaerophilaceae bacterium]HPT41570.1 S-layer homology domain-containing protein [Candidatus Gastranaerophilaceae bacterium]